MAGKSGILIYIYGIVQGVGFRPYTAELAKKHDIVGHVKNRGGFVEVLAAARAVGDESLRLFLHDLSACKLPGSSILHLETTPADVSEDDFKILPSQSDDDAPIMLPPDFAPCEQCMSELYDEKNRRYMHPFISCTACGARYSIIRDIPYDRETTSMAELSLCKSCDDEYNSPENPRYWAQTVCCNDCGPELVLDDLRGTAALNAAAKIISQGGILAVKGVGGYHLACSPFCEDALIRLRHGKRREEKPFAVMFTNLDELKKYCETDAKCEELLSSSARPIVLLKPCGRTLNPLVCRESAYVGAFLPSSAHQTLLLDKCGPLVMTSANPSGAPIATHSDELSDMPIDGILDHTRRIEIPLDDSVILPHAEGSSFIRRSRGYVPLAAYVKSDIPDTLAMGGDLKSAFGIRRGDWCYISQHLGDLEEIKNQNLYRDQIAHMTSLFRSEPSRIVCDLHPGYFSSAIAQEFSLPVFKLQHHYAHILSVMGEHGLDEPVIGIALDGVGYGEDNNIWGFEFLKCTRRGFTRCGHLKYTPMPASDQVMRDTRRAAMCYLISIGAEDVFFKDAPEIAILKAAQSAGINTVNVSSAGRLFDAAAYFLGCGEYNRFEGQCAQALEKLASTAAPTSALPFPIRDTASGFELDIAPLFDALVNGRTNPAQTAYAFHAAICDAVVSGACKMRDMYGINTVALGGGVFQNALLLTMSSFKLREVGFKVYRNEKYPSGDGGLALGQLTAEI